MSGEILIVCERESVLSGLVPTGILLCWLLSILPAVPMWIPAFDSRDETNDGSGRVCSFPYDSVSYGMVIHSQYQANEM